MKKAKRPQKQSKSKKVDNNMTPTNLHAEEQSELTEIQSDQTKSDNSTIREQTIALKTPKNQILLML